MSLGVLAAARRVVMAGLGLTLLITVWQPAGAQSSPAVLRLALLPQWVVQQHRGFAGSLSPDLRGAIDGGVVDRTVFSWQRGVIERRTFVPKPIRLVPDDEASALGGHGRFTLTAVRPPGGAAAWTEVEIARASAGADDVLLLEIGGERNTVTQVLATLLVAGPNRDLVEVPLAHRALVRGSGVPVVRSRFEQPIPAELAGQFRDEAGMGLLVVRGFLFDVENSVRTVNGLADTVPLGGGDWREGDRVFLRIPAAQLDLGLAGLVLVWKDRTLQNDPQVDFPRHSALPFPAIR
jgi:hypothetical protein